MSPKRATSTTHCASAKFPQNGAMTINMNDDNIVTIAQLREFSKLNNEGAKFDACGRTERNSWIAKTLDKFGYFKLTKKDKSAVKKYIQKFTGLSKSQLKKLIAKKKKTGVIIFDARLRHKFEKIYKPADIALLIKTDNLHNRMAGPATKEIMAREYGIFHKKEYKTISGISVSHLYNLRGLRQYVSQSHTFIKTNATKVLIGQRMKPDNLGIPGFLRVDTVHQGDLEKEKGVYHINIVDEVTQWEVVGCIQRISEQYLLPLLAELLDQFPFVIINFHSDNGSEFINKNVAQLLNKLLIRQTKSRARQHNDNAIVESKNCCIIRKNIGYRFIAKEYAPAFNDFYKNSFNPYLNFHRPCGYPTTAVNRKGKQTKKYDIYMTPYARFKSLPNAEKYLKPGITFVQLDSFALSQSDNEFAQIMQDAKDKLFSSFNSQKLQFPKFFLEARETHLGLIY